MRIKTYRGKRDEVMRKVKEEFGADALIVSSKELSPSAVELSVGVS